MFSQGHLVWAAISACVIAAVICICFKKKPKLKKLLRIALIIGIISEIIKYSLSPEQEAVMDVVQRGYRVEKTPSIH